MRTLPNLIILFGIFAISHGAETEDLEAFIKDIIETWQLRSPTILVKDVVPKMCMTRQWLLCLSNDQDTNELANHFVFVEIIFQLEWKIISTNPQKIVFVRILSTTVDATVMQWPSPPMKPPPQL